MKANDRDGPGDDGASLPLLTRDVFPAHLLSCFKYDTLTKVQQRVLRAAFTGRDNLMVSAPTGSGKTTVLEAAFLQAFERSRGSPVRKALYIAPVKALLQERLEDWRARFGKSTIGMKFVEFSGDTATIDEDEVDEAHVLLSTPEKWDAITRSGGARIRLVGAVELLLLDEIHHIGDASRGATLEAVVLRMMNLCKREHEEFSWQPIRDLRIVGLSATFSNAEDIASWIQCPQGGCLAFGSEFRPVPLSSRVVSCGDASNDFVFERDLDSRVFDIIRQFSSGKPSLVFCNSRMATSRLASHLSAEIKRAGIFDPMKRDRLDSLCKLEQLGIGTNVIAALKSGVGYHHAGLTSLERSTVENLFKASKLPILCCTSSLAVGVNLPAHLVVIKSTRLYQGAEGYIDYPKSQLLQMVGRAGRPGLDSSGVAVILTEDKRAEDVRDLLSGTASIHIDSQLTGKLLEVLNTEVALGTVRDRAAAELWFQQTYFAKSAKHRRNTVEDILLPSLEALTQSGMVRVRPNGELETTAAGSVMSQSYIEFETMKMITQTGKNVRTFDDLLVMLSKCVQVRMSMRRQEKSVLNQLNATATKFLVRNPDGTTSINSDEAKTNILIQAVLSKVDLGESYSKEEVSHALDEAARVLGAMVELLQRAESGEALFLVLRMRRCLELRSWDDSVGRFSLQQIPVIDSPTAAALEYVGIRSIKQLAQSSADRIDSFLRRQPPIGEHLIAQARRQKQFLICATWDAKQRGPLRTLRISVTSSNTEMRGSAVLIAWSRTDLLKYQPNIVDHYDCDVYIREDYHENIQIRLLQEKFIGLDSRLEISQSSTVEEPRTSLLGINAPHGKVTDSEEQKAHIQTPSTILRSILDLESHHAKVKQQKMPKFLLNKMALETKVQDLSSTTFFQTSPSVRVQHGYSKKREHGNSTSTTRSVRSRVRPAKSASTLAKNPTGSLNPFEKFRFTTSNKPNFGSQERRREPEKFMKTVVDNQVPVTLQQHANAIPASPLPTSKFESGRELRPCSSSYTHPFMKTFLHDRAKTISSGRPTSLLESARSSVEYSFLQRFVEQPEIHTSSSEEDESTSDAQQYVSPEARIVQSDSEHPFHSIFF